MRATKTYQSYEIYKHIKDYGPNSLFDEKEDLHIFTIFKSIQTMQINTGTSTPDRAGQAI